MKNLELQNLLPKALKFANSSVDELELGHKDKGHFPNRYY